jgi:hypothetical protein
MRTRYGPKTRKALSNDAIQDLYKDGFFDDWKAAAEIAIEINKNIPKYWGQVRAEAVRFIIQRNLYKNGFSVKKRTNEQRLEWRADGE